LQVQGPWQRIESLIHAYDQEGAMLSPDDARMAALIAEHVRSSHDRAQNGLLLLISLITITNCVATYLFARLHRIWRETDEKYRRFSDTLRQ
jgi:hypothetical protein